jgi:hypothetical protein
MSTRSRILAVALAVVMAASLFAVSAYASSAVGVAPPDQAHYFWWFGEPGTTNYPSFQVAPMGDDTVVGYTYSRTGTLTINFAPMTYMGIVGWFDYMDISAYTGATYTLYPDHTSTLIIPNAPADPTMISIKSATIYLERPDQHIPLDDLWFEVDFDTVPAPLAA